MNRYSRALDVLEMVHQHAILAVLKPAIAGDKAFVSIDMELSEAELATFQAFLADRG